MNDNGLESFALHSADKYQGPAVQAINDEAVTPGAAQAVDARPRIGGAPLPQPDDLQS